MKKILNIHRIINTKAKFYNRQEFYNLIKQNRRILGTLGKEITLTEAINNVTL